MIDDFFKIGELISVHEQKLELERIETELATPMLTNLEYIPQIFKWFCELTGYSEKGCDLNTIKKTQFLMIIQLYYSPISLTGHRMVNGVRDILMKLLGYKSGSAISNHLRNMLYTYNHYRVFREEVNVVCVNIQSRLEDLGILSKIPIL